MSANSAWIRCLVAAWCCISASTLLLVPNGSKVLQPSPDTPPGVPVFAREVSSKNHKSKIDVSRWKQVVQNASRLMDTLLSNATHSTAVEHSNLRSQSTHNDGDVQVVLPCSFEVIEKDWVLDLLSGCNLNVVKCPDFLVAGPTDRVVFLTVIGYYHFSEPAVNEYRKVVESILRNSINPALLTFVHVGDEWELGDAGRVTHVEANFTAGAAPDEPYVADNESLVHVDSWWKELTKIYAGWGSAFRQFDNGVPTYMPLGWTPKFAHLANAIVPASGRDHLLSFIGTAWGGRGELLAAYSRSMQQVGLTLNRQKDRMAQEVRLGHGRYHDDDDGYVATLGNSAFCLDLPGASSECYRLYEALEVGCIPVMGINTRLPMYDNNAELGLPPFVFADAAHVGATLLAIARAPGALDKLQQQNMHYWNAVKNKYRTAFNAAACPSKNQNSIVFSHVSHRLRNSA